MTESQLPNAPDHVVAGGLHFKRADVEARQKLYLYCALAEQIWNPARLKIIVEG
jgi:hypothetical protein